MKKSGGFGKLKPLSVLKAQSRANAKSAKRASARAKRAKQSAARRARITKAAKAIKPPAQKKGKAAHAAFNWKNLVVGI